MFALIIVWALSVLSGFVIGRFMRDRQRIIGALLLSVVHVVMGYYMSGKAPSAAKSPPRYIQFEPWKIPQ